ncbi:MAG: sugar phosphate isomerase/epimerase [Acidobacteriota bacterium]|nr:MAG: sugar phosphate isomerase/epimerase [Acidobacteriota bacterium]
MKISLCNEVVRELSFTEQCQLAALLGYDGIEVAPFTVAENPLEISAAERSEMRRAASDAGIEITSLHWLLLTPPGLSVTSPDSAVRQRTLSVMKGLVDLCGELGGRTLIHGSPKQREIPEGENRRTVEERAEEIFGAVAEHAAQVGVIYCIEPLSKAETNYINNLSEAAGLVQKIGNPAFQSMLDTKAANTAEKEGIPALVDRWLPPGLIAHVHVNDQNLRGPGQGDNRFAPVFAALLKHNYQGTVGVEPFDYQPDGPGSAARAIGYIRGILETLTYAETGD